MLSSLFFHVHRRTIYGGGTKSGVGSEPSGGMGGGVGSEPSGGVGGGTSGGVGSEPIKW